MIDCPSFITFCSVERFHSIYTTELGEILSKLLWVNTVIYCGEFASESPPITENQRHQLLQTVWFSDVTDVCSGFPAVMRLVRSTEVALSLSKAK